MKYCSQCRVSIENDIENCPLCSSKLELSDDQFENEYPAVLEISNRRRIILKIILFISVIAAGVSIALNHMNDSSVLWSLGVVAGLAYAWISLISALKSSKNIGLNLIIQILALSLLSAAIDYLSGWRGWSVNYVTPFLMTIGTVIITVITIIRPMQLRNYIVYLIDIAVLGLISLILIWTGTATVKWALIACSLYSIITLIGMFLFADRRARHEVKKRFHF